MTNKIWQLRIIVPFSLAMFRFHAAVGAYICMCGREPAKLLSVCLMSRIEFIYMYSVTYMVIGLWISKLRNSYCTVFLQTVDIRWRMTIKFLIYFKSKKETLETVNSRLQNMLRPAARCNLYDELKS